MYNLCSGELWQLFNHIYKLIDLMSSLKIPIICCIQMGREAPPPSASAPPPSAPPTNHQSTLGARGASERDTHTHQHTHSHTRIVQCCRRTRDRLTGIGMTPRLTLLFSLCGVLLGMGEKETLLGEVKRVYASIY